MDTVAAMNKWLRILVGLFAVVVVLVSIALAGLAVFFEPNEYKPQIDAAIERAIGREVNIDGPIRLSFFPRLGVRTGHVTVANAPGFGSQPIAEIKSAAASIRLLPLLAGQVRVGTVSLNDLRLRLTRHRDGHSNWQGVVANLIHRGHQAPAAALPPTGAGPDSPGSTATEDLPLSSLRISAIKINHAALDWDDARSDTHYRLNNLDLDTGRLTDGRPFRLEFAGDLRLPRDRATAHINVVSSIEPHLADHFYRFANLNVNVLVDGASIPGGTQEANMSAAGEIDGNAGRFSLDNITLQSAGAILKGKISGGGLNDRLGYNGRLTAAEFSPRSVLQQLELDPPRTRERSALTSASFDAQFEGDAKSVRFKQVQASLDESMLTGTARMDGFRRPHFVFDLNLDRLNVDDYMPPGSAEQAQTSQAPEVGGGGAQKDAEFDLSLLQRFNVAGHMGIGVLTVGSIGISNASMDLKIDRGRLDVATLSAGLYDGHLDLKGSVDIRASTPQFGLSGSLSRIRLQPLLRDLGQGEPLSARGDATLDVSATGQQVAELKRTLSGQVGFSLSDGQIHGVNLDRLVQAGKARPQADAGAAAVASGQATDFSRLDGHFAIRRGVMTGDDLRLVTPTLTGHGAGRYDIPRNSLDYMIRVDVPDAADGRLAGHSVPIRLSGPLLAPKYEMPDRSDETRHESNRQTGDDGSGGNTKNDVSGSSEDSQKP